MGFVEMNNLTIEYLNTICEIYPNLGTTLGISCNGYNDFSLDGKQQNSFKLKKFTQKLKKMKK